MDRPVIKTIEDVRALISRNIDARTGFFDSEDIYRITRLDLYGTHYVIGCGTLRNLIVENIDSEYKKGFLGFNQEEKKYFHKDVC